MAVMPLIGLTACRHGGVVTHAWLGRDFPLWLESVSTAVGVCAAIVAALYAARVYRQERRRDQSTEDRRKREQASLVSAWIEAVSRPSSHDPLGPLDANLAIRNASQIPVMGVHVFWSTTDDKLPSHAIYELDVLPPNDRPKVVPVQLIDLDGFSVAMTFIDAAGVTWHRHWDGALTEFLE